MFFAIWGLLYVFLGEARWPGEEMLVCLFVCLFV